MRVSVWTFAAALVVTMASQAGAEDLAPGKYRVVKKGQAPEWKGKMEADWDWIGDRYLSPSNNGMIVTWPEVAADDFGNKPVKFILFFGED